MDSSKPETHATDLVSADAERGAAAAAVAATAQTASAGARSRSANRASRGSTHSGTTVPAPDSAAVGGATVATPLRAPGSADDLGQSQVPSTPPAAAPAVQTPATAIVLADTLEQQQSHQPYQAPQSQHAQNVQRRLSVGGILKTNNAAKHMSTDSSHLVTKHASEAVLRKQIGHSPTASSARLRDLALNHGAAANEPAGGLPPALAPSSATNMQRSSTYNPSARKSIAVTIPVATAVAAQSPKAPSANAALRHLSTGPSLSIPSTHQPLSANLESQRMSYHGRSMTMSNSNQLPTPAPNMFYQQQQQYLNPQYRQYTPASPIVPQSPLYATPQPMAPQLQQVQPPPVTVPVQPPPLNPVQLQQPQQPQQPQQLQPQQPTAPQQPSLKLPLTPEITVQYYKDLLSPFELHEVYQYPHIYFAGAMGVDKIGTTRRRTGASGAPKDTLTKEDLENVYNNGYDDSRGDYYFTPHDHIGYRYECITILGKGSFGQVAKCFDHKTKSIVALKIIRNKKRFEKQGTVEVKVLDRLRKEDADNTNNLVHMLDSFYFRGHLCITFELLGTNLYEWVRSGGFRGIHVGVLKTMAVQILQCLQLLNRIKTVHCDLKPENILLVDSNFLQPQKCDLVPSSTTGLPRSFIDPEFNQHSPLYKVKVIDFGSSCYEHEKIYTYVQSRFYRSPEVILGISYTVAIDMWSFGCILAEMLTGYPLFPGENEQEQLACIMEVKGVPPEYIIDRGTRRKLFFESGQPRSFTNSKGRKRRPSTKSLSHVLRTTDVLFLDFIERCLEWDPERRMKPDEAMRHEWLVGFAPAVMSPSLSPPPMASASGRESIVSPSSSSHSTKYSFGEIMTNAANNITRRRELSISASHGSSADAKSKKTLSLAVFPDAPYHAPGPATAGTGEPSSWKASFSNWRRMGSISGPSSKKGLTSQASHANDLNIRKSISKDAHQSAASLSAAAAATSSSSFPPTSTGIAPVSLPASSSVSASSGNTVTVLTADTQLPAVPVIQESHSTAYGASSSATGEPADQGGSHPSLQVPAVPESGSKTPLENVVIDIIGTRSGSTTTATSRKSGDTKEGPSISRSLSFSKIGGMVRSLSQKKKK
ncbi:Dual specificity tyrosine-phosphorylation-regulated kinase [Chytriomyces hyalinus]|nr:Dual specificity tyrosine-phosphorylation-regulated kinase [Chytriomyces hyalinus]